MIQPPFFPDEEYRRRLAAVRQTMAERGLDACLVSVPENIYYLAGVSHWGFFATHLLILPREGEPVIIARAMEQVTMDIQLSGTRFVGFGDLDDPAQSVCRELEAAGLAGGRLGIEKNSLFLTVGIAERIIAGMPRAQWIDASDVVYQHRVCQSPLELAYTRQAAVVTDAMMNAAIESAGAGVSEREIAAEVHRAMVMAGGEYPGFGPFIRSTPTLGQEHGTWTDRVLEKGDVLFVELSGSVARYHAPMGRLFFVGEAPESARWIEPVCLEAFDAVVKTARPGVAATEVYQSWQDKVDAAGLAHYRRHHCGYMVGIAFPPAWSGGGVPVGLRHNSPMVLRAGMVFHLMSWLMHSGHGDYFVSNAAIVTETGCDVLTKIPQNLQVL
ncbi:MAG TPA: Xaa-Pro peptidase family protein [Anaerolineae bacterium]|nr:Xaa-Pro peptidase family protein [Anaerolineae bacterium]